MKTTSGTEKCVIRCIHKLFCKTAYAEIMSRDGMGYELQDCCGQLRGVYRRDGAGSAFRACGASAEH